MYWFLCEYDLLPDFISDSKTHHLVIVTAFRCFDTSFLIPDDGEKLFQGIFVIELVAILSDNLYQP
jgi:hypothetical protein